MLILMIIMSLAFVLASILDNTSILYESIDVKNWMEKIFGIKIEIDSDWKIYYQNISFFFYNILFVVLECFSIYIIIKYLIIDDKEIKIFLEKHKVFFEIKRFIKNLFKKRE